MRNENVDIREKSLQRRKTGRVHSESRPHGEWTNTGIGTICSVCGEALPFSDELEYETNFCPNCGADMRPRILDEAVDGEGKDGNVREGESE